MNRDLFGTDGVRGLAGKYPLDSDGARHIGMAVGMHFAKEGDSVVIGCDTRESSQQIVADLTSGLTAMGINVVSVGVLPTPGLAYITRENDFVAGVMVTASHNPFEYNGVKVFDAQGGKLDDSTEMALNQLIKQDLPERGVGQYTEDFDLLKTYEDFLVDSAAGLELNGLPMAVDSANGAASGLAKRVFDRLDARVTPLFDKPDGRNINDSCGATDTGALRWAVGQNSLSVGVAVDGDADRVIMADERGREVKGDYLLYILAVASNAQGVVATTMSNLGFELALKNKGIELVRTDVGDRYVLEGLEQTGYKLGGEQSGHIILPELLKTGDALLAAVQVLKAISGSGKTLAEWCDEVELLPQALVNISLDDKSKLESSEVKEFLDRKQDEFAGKGRLIIRPSGTEPLARVMVEAEDAESQAQAIAAELEQVLKEA